MGTTIDAVAVVRARRWRRTRSHRLAVRAGRACLARAGVTAADVDLLINAGLYHDHNMGEPALAALIQQDIGANPEDPHEGRHGTFSFDIANGACGMLTALQVADGFLAAGTIGRALVVASDTHPGRGRASRFPFAPVGAAVLCHWDAGPVGLSDFRFAGQRNDAAAIDAQVRFQHGRNRLEIDEPPGFQPAAATGAAGLALEALAGDGLTPAEVDLVVANPQHPAFLDTLGTRLGISGDRIVAAEDAVHVHTAGFAVALDAAARQGRLAPGRTVLVVSAGAGGNAGVALLRTR